MSSWWDYVDSLADVGKYLRRADDETPKPPPQYESLSDKRPAARNEFYGSGMDTLLEGKGKYLDDSRMPSNIQELWRNFEKLKSVSRPDTAAYLPDEARIAGRSAISSLGFDPRRFLLTKGEGYGNSTGAYARELDGGYADLTDRSTLVHEATHRGMKRIQDERGDEPSFGFSPEERLRDWWDELATRRLMQRIGAGVEDKTMPEGMIKERDFFGWLLDRYLGQLEEDGTKLIAKKRGPK